MNVKWGQAQGEPGSATSNARSLGLWAESGGRWRLGRRSDGLLLPGSVRGSLDRARRCWHALIVLHTDAEKIINAMEASGRQSPAAQRLLADWARLTD